MGLIEQVIEKLNAAGLRAEESYPGRPIPYLQDVAAAVSGGENRYRGCDGDGTRWDGRRRLPGARRHRRPGAGGSGWDLEAGTLRPGREGRLLPGKGLRCLFW